MNLTNIGGFNTIGEYIENKIGNFSKDEKSFSVLFDYMFSDYKNVFSETTDGYRIIKTTYGELKNQILCKIEGLSKALSLQHGSTIGIYMDNSVDWIKFFWAVLACGYTPLLMNKRLPKEFLETTILDYGVSAVISDGEVFSVKTINYSDITDSTIPSKKPECFGSEVIFMSSGTTKSIKLCSYTAENFYYQLANSVEIIKECPQISSHYNGELKLLTLLPLYHVFGFIAVYLWFGFFSRTFVFLKDMAPKTIQNTVKKHNVTHVFAVPLVWEKVYKATISAAMKKGKKTHKKLLKAIKASNNSAIGKKLFYKKLGEVREQIFGDSIQFLISGGGYISNDTIAFYNGIGYHLSNGFGMTEVGITSVDRAQQAKIRNLGSIGKPFKHSEYKINEEGQLLIRGKSMASRIYADDREIVTDFNEWFNTFDLAKSTTDGYFMLGRSDDLIISTNGENINPQLVENALNIEGAESICLFSENNVPILLISTNLCFSKNKASIIIESAKHSLEKLGLISEINKIYLTPDKLIKGNDFKISRQKIAKEFAEGKFTLIDENSLSNHSAKMLDELESGITAIFAEVLQIDSSAIQADAHFFTSLGGSSIDYFMLSSAIEEKYGVDIKLQNGKSLYTVNEISDFIKRQ